MSMSAAMHDMSLGGQPPSWEAQVRAVLICADPAKLFIVVGLSELKPEHTLVLQAAVAAAAAVAQQQQQQHMAHMQGGWAGDHMGMHMGGVPPPGASSLRRAVPPCLSGEALALPGRHSDHHACQWLGMDAGYGGMMPMRGDMGGGGMGPGMGGGVGVGVGVGGDGGMGGGMGVGGMGVGGMGMAPNAHGGYYGMAERLLPPCPHARRGQR